MIKKSLFVAILIIISSLVFNFSYSQENSTTTATTSTTTNQNESSGDVYSRGNETYKYVSSFDGSEAEKEFTNTDTKDIGNLFNYLLTIMAVAIVILIIYRLLAGAVIKGTFDNIYDQMKGKEYIKTAGTALIIFIFAYAILSFINPDLTGWSVATKYIGQVRLEGVNNGGTGGGGGGSGGMCGIKVSGPEYCQDTDAVNPFGKDNAPRGLRNNNPGNIKHGGSNWYGICEKQSDATFVQFKNPEGGIRAMGKLLINYQKDKQLDTIAKIINTWAPGSDNNDPASYAAVVAKTIGVGVNDKLPDLSADLTLNGALFKFIKGITQVENGNKEAYNNETILNGLKIVNQNLSGTATCSSNNRSIASRKKEIGIPGNSLPDTSLNTSSGGGINNIKNIVNALVGKVTYRFGAKGNANETYDKCPGGGVPCGNCPANTVCGDCSWFVNFVLKKAGLNYPGGGTYNMRQVGTPVSSLTKTTVNNKQLTPGDLLVMPGHVVIYIGDGKAAESVGGDGRYLNNAIQIQDADHYKKTISHVIFVK